MATETTALVRMEDMPRLDPPDRAEISKFEAWIPESTELLAITVSTASDVARASEAKHTADERIKDINSAFAEPTAVAHKIHKFLTGERGRLLEPWENVIKAMQQRVQVYDREQQRKARELQERLQLEAERAQREAEERARIRREEEEAALMPWDIADAPVAPPAPPVHVPVVVVPPPPRLAGTVGKTEKNIEVNLEELVLSTAAAITERGDRSGLQLLQADMIMIRQVCKREGTAVSDLYPGITYTTQKGSRLR